MLAVEAVEAVEAGGTAVEAGGTADGGVMLTGAGVGGAAAAVDEALVVGVDMLMDGD